MPSGAFKSMSGKPPAGGPTTYVEEDFRDTTSGDLGDDNLDVDEVGSGWVGATASYDYQAAGAGINCTGGSAIAVVQTSGRIDVLITVRLILGRGDFGGTWNGLYIRAASSNNSSGLGVQFTGGGTDPDIKLRDGSFAGGDTLKTWDLSALMTTPPNDGETVDLIMECNGNVIELISIAVDDATPEVIEDAYTLTGTPATDHGAGSGADFYGLGNNNAGSGARFHTFQVRSI